MHILRLAALATACLAAGNAAAAQHDCVKDAVVASATHALKQDARDTAEREAMKHAPRYVPAQTLGHLWDSVADRLSRRTEKKAAEEAPAVARPDCR